MEIERRVPATNGARSLATAGMILMAMATAACSNAPTCDEPQMYEMAKGGPRIEVPEGLDDLESFKEMSIPEASPRPPREPGSGCLDRPPTLRIDDEEGEEEGEEEA